MVSGLRNFEPALPENDENCDGVTTTNPADEWIHDPNQNSSIEIQVQGNLRDIPRINWYR